MGNMDHSALHFAIGRPRVKQASRFSLEKTQVQPAVTSGNKPARMVMALIDRTLSENGPVFNS
jgi:hypothetical protein